MGKPSNFSIMADAMAEIRRDIAELRARMDAPSQRERLTALARADKETPDPTPVEIPGGMVAPDTIQEMIQRYVRNEVSQQAAMDNLGTFEEEDDFTEDDTDDLPFSEFDVTDYELEPDPEMPPTDDADPPADEVPTVVNPCVPAEPPAAPAASPPNPPDWPAG